MYNSFINEQKYTFPSFLNHATNKYHIEKRIALSSITKQLSNIFVKKWAPFIMQFPEQNRIIPNLHLLAVFPLILHYILPYHTILYYTILYYYTILLSYTKLY